MSRERPPDFAERLPDVVPREEADISHLSDEMADLLYPGRRPRPFRMGVVFDVFEGPDYAKAVELGRRAAVFRDVMEGNVARHHVEFETTGADDMRDLMGLVGARAGTDVLVEGRRVPYARELWLPLFYLFVRGR